MKIVVPLATGFEEIEAVTVIDVLRRAGIEVVIASLDSLGSLGDAPVIGAHSIVISSSITIDALDENELDGIVLPGGMPGASNLRDHPKVIKLIQDLAQNDKLVGAICAAPIVLEKAGVIKDKQVTCFPGFENELASANVQQTDCVIDGNIITAQGPSFSLTFALNIVEMLIGAKKRQEIQKAMLI
jgi:4-methyl-5(b-hydroxyethyl)-thiazole monophosphate biosynthesis